MARDVVPVIAVASPIHPSMQRVAVLKRMLQFIEGLGLNVKMLSEPVTSIEEAWSIRDKVLEVDRSLLILHLTGGTSKIAVEVAKWSNAPVTLIAHGESNSLPSSLEAYNRLRLLGVDVRVSFVDRGRGLEYLVGEKHQRGMLIMGDVSPKAFDIVCPAALAHRLKVKVGMLKLEELERYMSGYAKSAQDLVDSFLSRFKGLIQVPLQELQLSLALTEAVKELVEKHRCNVFTFDCFELLKRINVTPCLAISLLSEGGVVGVCEADIQAAACMSIVSGLTTPFMGNIVSVDEEQGLLTLAHCTAPMSLASRPEGIKLKTHFETDKSVAVDVPIIHGKALLVSCSSNLKKAYIAECEVLKSQMEHRNMCRTQALLKLKAKPSRVLSTWPSGHAVLALRVAKSDVEEAFRAEGFEVEEVE